MSLFSPPPFAVLIVAQLNGQLNSQIIDASNLDIDNQLSIVRNSNAFLFFSIDFILLRVPLNLKETRRRVFNSDFQILDKKNYNRL